jgi:DNA-binding response OmpR family regulator
MPRPTLLVAEREPIQALSVRKLVLETAKYNVLTAHSTREALDIFHLFPNISMAVLVGGSGVDCDEVAKVIKAATDKVPIIFLHPQMAAMCKNADHQLSSYEPEKLLELTRSLLGDPRTEETSC